MGGRPALCDSEPHGRPGTVYSPQSATYLPTHPPSQEVGSVYIVRAAIAASSC